MEKYPPESILKLIIAQLSFRAKPSVTTLRTFMLALLLVLDGRDGDSNKPKDINTEAPLNAEFGNIRSNGH